MANKEAKEKLIAIRDQMWKEIDSILTKTEKKLEEFNQPK